MEVKFDEVTMTFSLVGMTFEQLNTVLNCIAFATEHGARMPKKQGNS